ncbi:13084_t:CDS:2, partial [Dentiscutata heterogama]
MNTKYIQKDGVDASMLVNFCNVQLLAKQLEWAIDILEIALLDTMLVFGFGNSSSHRAFAEDAL